MYVCMYVYIYTYIRTNDEVLAQVEALRSSLEDAQQHRTKDQVLDLIEDARRELGSVFIHKTKPFPPSVWRTDRQRERERLYYA